MAVSFQRTLAAIFIRMNDPDRIDADDPEMFGAELASLAPSLPARIDAQPEDIEAGVAKLVLTIVELVRQVLEHQAVRRMEGGELSEEQIERLGLALMRLQDKLGEIRTSFGLEPEDLNIDLGPLGRLL